MNKKLYLSFSSPCEFESIEIKTHFRWCMAIYFKAVTFIKVVVCDGKVSRLDSTRARRAQYIFRKKNWQSLRLSVGLERDYISYTIHSEGLLGDFHPLTSLPNGYCIAIRIIDPVASDYWPNKTRMRKPFVCNKCVSMDI